MIGKTNVLKLVVSTLAVLLVLSCAVSLWSRTGGTSNFEKRIRCENRSREQWWQCRQRAVVKKGKNRDRALAICQNLFVSSMERCRRYE